MAVFLGACVMERRAKLKRKASTYSKGKQRVKGQPGSSSYSLYQITEAVGKTDEVIPCIHCGKELNPKRNLVSRTMSIAQHRKSCRGPSPSRQREQFDRLLESCPVGVQAINQNASIGQGFDGSFVDGGKIHACILAKIDAVA